MQLTLKSLKLQQKELSGFQLLWKQTLEEVAHFSSFSSHRKIIIAQMQQSYHKQAYKE